MGARHHSVMPRFCAFCHSSEPLSREHLFPDWASQYFERDGKLAHHRHSVAEDQPSGPMSSWQQKAFEWKVTAVCGACNNGWMSKLEEASRVAVFNAAFTGHGRQLQRNGQRTLAAWALKTAMMAEHSERSARRQIADSEYVHLYERGEPSGSVRIWMTSYIGGKIVAVASLYGLDADMAQEPDRDRGERDIWGSTISLGPVVFQLLGSEVPGVLDAFQVNAPNMHQLWPRRRTFTWMPSVGLNDKQLVGLNDEFLDALRTGRTRPNIEPLYWAGV